MIGELVTLEVMLKTLRERFITLFLCLAVAVGASGALAVFLPQKFTAVSVAYVKVSVPEGDNQSITANSYYSASQLAVQKVSAFVPLFTSEVVASGVIHELGLSLSPSQLASSISANSVKGGLTVEVHATASSAVQAQQIADEVVRQTEKQIRLLEGEGSPVGIVLLAPSELSQVTVWPSLPGFLVAGAAIGLLVGVGLALLLSVADRRIRTEEQVAAISGKSLLARLPRLPKLKKEVIKETADFRVEEELRRLRTNLRYTNVDREPRVILVTSANQGEGKSTVAAGLAKVLALAGNEVVLLDADLRRPTVCETFDIDADAANVGLAHLLVEALSLRDVLIPTKIEGLKVIPAGDTPPNPSELLGSKKMQELLVFLAGHAYVVIDAPPILPVADALILAESVDGVLVVARSGKTLRGQLRRTLEALENCGASVLGLVLNAVPSSLLGRMRYGNDAYTSRYEYAGRKSRALQEVQVDETPVQERSRPDELSQSPIGEVSSSSTEEEVPALPVAAAETHHSLCEDSLPELPQEMNGPPADPVEGFPPSFTELSAGVADRANESVPPVEGTELSSTDSDEEEQDVVEQIISGTLPAGHVRKRVKGTPRRGIFRPL